MNVVLDDYKNDENKDTYDRILKMYPVSVLEPAVSAYYLARHHNMDIKEFSKLVKNTPNGDAVVEALNFAMNIADSENDIETGLMTTICVYQYIAQIERFKRTKQVYNFDKDFLSELYNTDPNIPITGELFQTLPHRVMYLDYSANRELCDAMKTDGTLITVLDIGVGDEIYWILFCAAYYEGKSTFVHSLIMPNSNEPITVAEMVNSREVMYYNEDATKSEASMIMTLMQALIYLCSFEPDIRETPMSKQRYKEAKAKKPKDKKAKVDMPEREYKVGEYFGAAFRKYTIEHADETTKKSTGTGSSKRPHMRRAHWHGYWRGKKGSENRTLVRRWVHESFINVDYDTGEKKLGVAKHKVK